MPKASSETASQTFVMDGYEARFEPLAGGYTVGFETFTTDTDPAELFRGLPDDRCQSPHWGYVIEGRVKFRYADHEETCEAGDAYYAPPGHVPLLTAGTRIVEFSPTDALDETVGVVVSNLRAAGVPV